MEYSAPWGRPLILVSSVLTFLLSGMAAVSWLSVRAPLAVRVALTLIPVILLGGCLLYTIRGYRLEGARLLVRRLLWETEVDLTGLDSVKRDPDCLRGSLRLFGNGGLFSLSGIFWSRRLGRYRAFVTDRNNAVLLGVGGRTVAISPGDPDAFVREILESTPRMPRSVTYLEEEPS